MKFLQFYFFLIIYFYFSYRSLLFWKDPEALAQLMKNMPLTSDGKFLLLEPETGDTSNGAEEDLESEA